jgi:heptosyltransferase-2
VVRGLHRWQKVLVLQTSFLGDTVLTLPLLAEIKRRFPSAKLAVLCSPLGKKLLQDHPDIDTIIVDDKKGADKGLLGLWRIAKTLRQRGFTLALTPHKSLRSALMLYLARIPFRVGFRQSKGWFLFHARVERDPGRHDVERNLSLLQAFDIRAEECQRSLHLPVESAVQESVKNLLRSLGVDPQRLLIGINPGSVWATKRWSAEGFARAIHLIKNNYACDVLLFGGPEDAAVVSRIEELCGASTVNLLAKLDLHELPAALGLCRVLVTNDSGPMHIAVARDVPTVAIFCATTPGLGFYPYSANSIVLEKILPCRPCSSHGGRRCPLGTEDCIRLVSPEQVLGAVQRLLARERATPPASSNLFKPEFVSV